MELVRIVLHITAYFNIFHCTDCDSQFYDIFCNIYCLLYQELFFYSFFCDAVALKKNVVNCCGCCFPGMPACTQCRRILVFSPCGKFTGRVNEVRGKGCQFTVFNDFGLWSLSIIISVIIL